MRLIRGLNALDGFWLTCKEDLRLVAAVAPSHDTAMRMSLRYRSLLPLIIGFALLALTVLGSLWLADRQERSFEAVRHTLEVQKRLGMILSRFQDAETGSADICLPARSLISNPMRPRWPDWAESSSRSTPRSPTTPSNWREPKP